MLGTVMAATAADPVTAVRNTIEVMRGKVEAVAERNRFAAGPLVIFIVAAAIVLALAVVAATAVALFCISKGGSVEWWTTNGWKVWELKIACRMP